MAGVFETATRAAIEEIVQEHAKSTKFGYVLTENDLNGLIDEVLLLFVTSRNLKAAGDRLLAGGGAPSPRNTSPATKALRRNRRL